jgi:hypothetical protein
MLKNIKIFHAQYKFKLTVNVNTVMPTLLLCDTEA